MEHQGRVDEEPVWSPVLFDQLITASSRGLVTFPGTREDA